MNEVTRYRYPWPTVRRDSSAPRTVRRAAIRGWTLASEDELDVS
jgi:hypothetical protein